MLTNFTGILAASTQAPTFALPPPTTLERGNNFSFSTQTPIPSSVSQYSLPTSVPAIRPSHGNSAPSSMFERVYTISPTENVTEDSQPMPQEISPPDLSPGIGICVVCSAGQFSRVACGGSRRQAASIDASGVASQNPIAERSIENVDDKDHPEYEGNDLDTNMEGHKDRQGWGARTKTAMCEGLQMTYHLKHWGEVCLTCLELLWKMKLLAPEVIRRTRRRIVRTLNRGRRKSAADIV